MSVSGWWKVSAGLIERLALERVHRGYVMDCGGLYVDRGRPVPCYLPGALTELTEQGLLQLDDPVTEGVPCMRRVSMTDAGRARYAELDRPGRQPLRDL